MFDQIVEPKTAGLPQKEDVRWTDLSCTQIVAAFQQQGIHVSHYLVKQMLNVRGYKKRKLLKMDTLSQTENRNEQFEKIKVYRQQFTDMNFPVLSIDTKKKEMLGNFWFIRRMRTYQNSQKVLTVNENKLINHIFELQHPIKYEYQLIISCLWRPRTRVSRN